MPFTFPQYPDQKVFLTYFTDIPSDVLETVKSQLIAANKDYDFCFLNTNHIVSNEHLNSGIYRAIQNFNNDSMKAKTLNTEIIFNLSPINNIMDAIKRFGVDTTCPNVIVIKILFPQEDPESVKSHLEELLGTKSSELTDETLFKSVDVPKLKKIYKLNDAVLENGGSQSELTRLAVSACQLRGL